ncbi:MAG: phosphoribosylaminoimidazolesuccinocarboxamide synthase [Xanthomonadales bacterium]|nr:phosphoribosylaminoimidazolesuccinocarboxamide synthase [Gammaproteobacteria bacterium]MBT8075628.1 phosphoribosylaminoimidazolesuccinocarboxamide synthase [Gammaproteobacteria bacterium]NNK04187.1 phosphoribosylaminoimidazolesuccinocarboxamide synthase [Xanthomonadales bacterium]NNK98798.1 phosphoribosylaminoimidazolesuccinocarboxamide synthase [Xanthomonadales bacterium]
MLDCLPLIHQGKVRDSFALDDDHMMIVASDRLSAFDVVLPDPVPGKGALLTRVSNFWFEQTRDIIDNHLTGIPIGDVLADPQLVALLEDRAVIVRRLSPLPVEAIVRGYLIGSGWKDYQQTGAVCGIPLPPGLRQADKLPEVLFTPSTKAAAGDHDINVDFATIVELIGEDLANQVRDASIGIYEFAAAYALERGIIIADTKFEFGLDAGGKLYLMDEVLTPDSSRFWPKDKWQPGISPPSFDKQFVRDYLETLDWNKQAPGPKLPPEIIDATVKNYQEACRILTA